MLHYLLHTMGTSHVDNMAHENELFDKCVKSAAPKN